MNKWVFGFWTLLVSGFWREAVFCLFSSLPFQSSTALIENLILQDPIITLMIPITVRRNANELVVKGSFISYSSCWFCEAKITVKIEKNRNCGYKNRPCLLHSSSGSFHQTENFYSYKQSISPLVLYKVGSYI